MFNIIPILASVVTKLVPPYEIKGNVTPETRLLEMLEILSNFINIS